VVLLGWRLALDQAGASCPVGANAPLPIVPLCRRSVNSSGLRQVPVARQPSNCVQMPVDTGPSTCYYLVAICI
jgi:hypothetical protein